jgi:hypothetical protein
VLDDGAIVADIRLASVDDFDTVAVKVEHCSVEVIILFGAGGRGAIRTSTSI